MARPLVRWTMLLLALSTGAQARTLEVGATKEFKAP